MGYVEYNGTRYCCLEVTLSSGETFLYGQRELLDAIDENGDNGNDLDNLFCFYVEKDDLEALGKLCSREASDNEIIGFCNRNDIYIGEYT